MDRPPPDPSKLLADWTDTLSGEITPGRGLSNLKTGGLPDMLTHLGDAVADVVAAWTGWERGEVPPAEVVGALHGAGLGAALERLAAEA